VAPGVPVLSVSPRDGDGISEVLGLIESPMAAGQRLLQIDYDIYADGEAELGWVNLSSHVTAENAVDLDGLASALVGAIGQQIVAQDGQIAHLKVSVLGGDAQAVANLVSNESTVDVGLAAAREMSGKIQLIVNARVAIDPDLLEQLCRQTLHSIAESKQLQVDSVTAFSLRPGRPTPTHRVTG
jgi:hypothetical protein